MNDPPPVLHRGTMYSCPTGWAAEVAPGLLSRHFASRLDTRSPEPSQFCIDTGNTTGMNRPPVRAPVTAVASAPALNWSKPMARAKVVGNVRLPPIRTPWDVGGMTPPPTWAAEPAAVT